MDIDGISIPDDRVVHLDRLNVVIRGLHGTVCLNRYSPIGRSYLFYGEHGENELTFCRNFIPEGGTVVDVGAHQGTHTLAFSRAVGDAGTVVSLEPQRMMFQNILATAALNSLTNVHAVNAAVGAAPGHVQIVEYDYARRGHFSGMAISEQNTGERVPLVPLDEILLSEMQLDRLDFLKIDVEGYEPHVLLGARKLIEMFCPIIYHEFHEDGDSNAAILDFMKSIGYVTHLHAPSGFNSDNHFGYAEDRFNGGRDHNAVSLPKDKQDQFARVLADCEPAVTAPDEE